VHSIAAVMFEPVGCLAEFAAGPFDDAARELFGATDTSGSGSQAYWRLLELLDQKPAVAPHSAARLESLELAAAEQADLYEDVAPALKKLRDAGVNLHLVSSLSRRALARFVERFALADAFAHIVARDDTQGVLEGPLRHAVGRAAVDPAQVIYLVDNSTALAMAKRVGVNAVLMINDYDEGRALAEHRPSGGIVSLAELADALELIGQRSSQRSASRMPHKPFELFEPG